MSTLSQFFADVCRKYILCRAANSSPTSAGISWSSRSILFPTSTRSTFNIKQWELENFGMTFVFQRRTHDGRGLLGGRPPWIIKIYGWPPRPLDRTVYTPVVFCCRSSVRIVVTEMSLKNLLGTFSGIKNDTTVLFRFNI